MTHRLHPGTSRDVVELLAENAFGGMAQAIEILLDECMRIESQEFLGLGPYPRSEKRKGRANGFKPKRVKTRVGDLEVSIPQRRDVKFNPLALEKGCLGENTLRLPLAVSTVKVNKITEELCGCEVSSCDVSRAAKELDVELEQWSNRPLGEIEYLTRCPLREDSRWRVRSRLCDIDRHWRRSGASSQRAECERRDEELSGGGRGRTAVVRREFFNSLIACGMHGVELIAIDAHAGMTEACRG